MRLAITGTTGRVGRALADRLGDRFEILELPSGSFDLRSPGVVERIGALNFDVLLNPAGVTSLEICEDDPVAARLLNTEVPVALGKMCRERGRKMLNFSTDYVLGGREEGLHSEGELPEPLSVYGASKEESERGVLASGGVVVRVSWVFGPERPAFPDSVIDKALAGKPLAAIADKTSLPCYTKDLAQWVAGLIGLGCPNQIVHLCQAGEPMSWFDMTEEVLDCMVEAGALKERPPVTRQELAGMSMFRATRPRHTALSTERLTQLLGQRPRDWRVALREHVMECLISR